jgi:hypothetical protein
MDLQQVGIDRSQLFARQACNIGLQAHSHMPDGDVPYLYSDESLAACPSRIFAQFYAVYLMA